VLDEASFKKQIIEGEQAALVMFFAPWCGHCKAAAPEFKKAALRLRGGGVRVIAIDGDQCPNVVRSLGIKGFPTIQYISRGKSVDYTGPRSAIAMGQFAQTRARLDGIKSTVISAFGGVKTAMSKVLGRQDAKQPA